MDPIRRAESPCRSLFGPVDHDQLRTELTLRLRAISEQDGRRWNFSFRTETPLPGRFQWEEVPAGCAASFYRGFASPRDDVRTPNPEEGVRPSSREQSPGTDRENRPGVSNCGTRPAEVTPVRRKRALLTATARPRVSARAPDVFVKRRTENRSALKQLHTTYGEGALS